MKIVIFHQNEKETEKDKEFFDRVEAVAHGYGEERVISLSVLKDHQENRFKAYLLIK